MSADSDDEAPTAAAAFDAKKAKTSVPLVVGADFTTAADVVAVPVVGGAAAGIANISEGDWLCCDDE